MIGLSFTPRFAANVPDVPENRPDTVNIGNIRKGTIVRTRLGICVKKKRYQSLEQAALAGNNGPLRLRPYRCRLCRQYHLTSRTKGMFVGRKSDKAAP
jgi:hypothetical protein